MEHYVCIHGHFYQPPRENAWLEAIEQQDSAYPYHDWNERIAAECYEPNAWARILDGKDRIIRIVNNYSSISFDFGPTLLAWLQEHAAETYTAVLAADRESMGRFRGHGSAIAQAYSHAILPLSNERDRDTELLWGLRDFEYRFGRRAEGMWLPETAVNTATLEGLAQLGVRFTILAPRQAASVRRFGSETWTDVSGARVDTRHPYVCRLPSGREIAVFFYDGAVSQSVAFEGMLRDGRRFAERLAEIHHRDDTAPQLAHIATDGETYGHHHRRGEMALAYAIHHIETHGPAHITNYSAFLALCPPQHEVRLIDNSSWSCVHGVERWRSDCGCHTGGRPGWNQAWRAPLRTAFDWLRDALAPRFEEAASRLVRDPWAARDDYIAVVLDRSPASIRAFLERHASLQLDPTHRIRLLKLLELQRHALLMYTSCGWFFNDLAGIETVQVLQYAARAVQLAEELFSEPYEEQLVKRLELAHSNDAERGNGRDIWDAQVKPARVDLLNVAAHYAVSSLFEGYEKRGRVYCYSVDVQENLKRSNAEATLSVGRASVISRVTQESDTVGYAVLHFGGHNLKGGIRRLNSNGEYTALVQDMTAAFDAGDVAQVRTLLDNFPEYAFSLKSLFTDRQREILHRLLDARVAQAEQEFRTVYQNNVDLMRYLIDLELPLPRAFTLAAEFVLNRELRRALDADALDLVRARALLEEARAGGVPLDEDGLGFVTERTLHRLVTRSRARPERISYLEQIAAVAELARSASFDVDLWKSQNLFYALVREVLPAMRERAAHGDESAVRWVRLVTAVGEQLAVAVPH
jgi:alpha-amylase/alpha-mannosidase (GH57 family)